MGKAIEVILLDDVKNLGRSGDTCKVKAGYARNFLFPQKQATVLTPGTKRLVEKKKAEGAHHRSGSNGHDSRRYSYRQTGG